MIYFNKILPALLLPIVVTLTLLIAGLALKRRLLMWLAVAILWIAGTPIVAATLMRATEEWAVRADVGAAPSADAVVVLSGGRVTAPGSARVSEWSDPDRFFSGIELLQAGKAPVIVFTGGWAPWEPDAPLEGDVLKRHAIALGVSAERVLTTGRVTNTAEEAAAVSALLRRDGMPAPRILLVTSAFHMPRARAQFERTGLQVAAFPVDFQISSAGLDVLQFIPSAGALAVSSVALREMYGRLFYRLVSLRQSL